jgi:hypothetical protein
VLRLVVFFRMTEPGNRSCLGSKSDRQQSAQSRLPAASDSRATINRNKEVFPDRSVALRDVLPTVLAGLPVADGISAPGPSGGDNFVDVCRALPWSGCGLA